MCVHQRAAFLFRKRAHVTTRVHTPASPLLDALGCPRRSMRNTRTAHCILCSVASLLTRLSRFQHSAHIVQLSSPAPGASPPFPSIAHPSTTQPHGAHKNRSNRLPKQSVVSDGGRTPLSQRRPYSPFALGRARALPRSYCMREPIHLPLLSFLSTH